MATSAEVIEGIRYFPDLVHSDLASRIRAELLQPAAHGGAEILIDGVWYPSPRLVSSYADQVLQLDGMEASKIWSGDLRELRDLVARELDLSFNYALANLYRDEGDYTGWHSDKAGLHAGGSSIVILSFGATRRLAVRSYATPEDVTTIALEEGSAVVMNLDVQATHEHTVLREPEPTGPRLSITLRNIIIDPRYVANVTVA